MTNKRAQWGITIFLDENKTYDLLVGDTVVLRVSVRVMDDSVDHTPKSDGTPDLNQQSGDSILLGEDGRYVIEIDKKPEQRLVIVVETGLSEIPPAKIIF